MPQTPRPISPQVSDYEVLELFSHVIGLQPPEIGDLTDDMMAIIEDRIQDRYSIGIDDLVRIVSDLLPFCAEGTSPLTQRSYRGFAADGAFIIKQQVEEGMP